MISTSMWERENIHPIYCVFSPLFRDISNLDYTFRVCLDRTYFAETENKKYYSKIIFKCMNSVVGPIFNEKVAETWNLWVYEQCTNALFTVEKSTFAVTVQWTVVTLLPETREKKKKKWIHKRRRSFTIHKLFYKDITRLTFYVINWSLWLI